MTVKALFWQGLTVLTVTFSVFGTVVNFDPTLANPAVNNQPISPSSSSSKLLRTLSGHTAPVRAIALSADGTILASGGDDKIIKLWNTQTGQLISNLNGHTGEIISLAITPDGQTLVSGARDNNIKLWNLKTGKLIRNLPHTNPVTSFVITPTGQTLISAGGYKTIKLWNLQTGQLRRTLNTDVVSLAISRDGKTLYSGGEEGGKIRLWNLNTGKLLQTLIPPRPKNPTFPNQQASRVSSLALSPDGQILIAGGNDNSHQSLQETDGKNMKVWNLKTGKLIHNFSVGVGYVPAVVIHPNGQTVANGGLGRDIQLWNSKTGKIENKLSGHAGGIYGLAFSKDGKTLYSGSGDKSVKVWQISPR